MASNKEDPNVSDASIGEENIEVQKAYEDTKASIRELANQLTSTMLKERLKPDRETVNTDLPRQLLPNPEMIPLYKASSSKNIIPKHYSAHGQYHMPDISGISYANQSTSFMNEAPVLPVGAIETVTGYTPVKTVYGGNASVTFVPALTDSINQAGYRYSQTLSEDDASIKESIHGVKTIGQENKLDPFQIMLDKQADSDDCDERNKIVEDWRTKERSRMMETDVKQKDTDIDASSISGSTLDTRTNALTLAGMKIQCS